MSKPHRWIAALSLSWLLLGVSCAPLSTEPASSGSSTPAVRGVNLAAHAKYECASPPNYWGWKGPEHKDTGRLADGRILESWADPEGKHFYALPSAAGWSEVKPVVIVFDLGMARSIAGIGLHSLLSPWGPYWPAEITVMVSDDNTHFQLAAPPLSVAPAQLSPPLRDDVVQAAIDRVLPQKGIEPTTHWYRTDQLAARGRYVALILMPHPSTGVIVLDEVEIHEGRADFQKASRPKQVFAEGKGGVRSYQLYGAMGERVSRDMAALKEKIGPKRNPARHAGEPVAGPGGLGNRARPTTGAVHKEFPGDPADQRSSPPGV